MGAILAEDMTIEAVIAKLSYIIGKGYKGPEIKKMMLTNMRGEISVDDDVTGEEDESVTLTKILASLTKNTGIDTKEALNSVTHILQPLILHSAAKDGNINRMKELIDDGVNVNLADKYGYTALHVAVNNGDTNMVSFLLEQNDINLHLEDCQGNSALFYACLNGSESIAGMLSFKGATFHSDHNKLPSVLCRKARINDLGSIKLFHKAGADLEAKDYDDRTLAHIAACEGHSELLTYLAENTDFNFDLKDRHQRTPIDEIEDDTLAQQIRQLFLSKKSNGKKEEVQN